MRTFIKSEKESQLGSQQQEDLCEFQTSQGDIVIPCFLKSESGGGASESLWTFSLGSLRPVPRAKRCDLSYPLITCLVSYQFIIAYMRKNSRDHKLRVVRSPQDGFLTVQREVQG